MRRIDLPAPPPPNRGTRYPLHPRYQLLQGPGGDPLLVERSGELDEPDFRLLAEENVWPWIGLRGAHLVPFYGLAYWHKQAFRYYAHIPSWSLGSLLSSCQGRQAAVPVEVASAVVAGVLRGAQAIHEARGPQGDALGMVHRTIGPRSVLVGHDGIARLFDYAPIRPWERHGSDEPEGTIRVEGLNLLAPEQILAQPLDARVDVYASAALLWWMLTGQMPFRAGSDIDALRAILDNRIEPPSSLRPGLDPALDRVVMRGLSRLPDDRFATAREMVEALEEAAKPATPLRVASWARAAGGVDLVPCDDEEGDGAEGGYEQGAHPYRGASWKRGRGRDEGHEAPRPRAEFSAEVPAGLLVALGVGLIAACTLIKSCTSSARPRPTPTGAAARVQP